MKFYKFLTKLSVLAGASLEYYDYMLFNLMMPFIAPEFYKGSGLDNLASGYLVILISSVARPLGAWFFGSIGDKHGRKKALFLSMMIMSASSFLIYLLPGYLVIGVFAPIILLICRMMQTMSAAGELNGSAIFLIEGFENDGKKKSGLASSLAWFFTVLGMVAGAYASHICTLHNWRIAFLIGGFIGFFALFLRLSASSERKFYKHKKELKLISIWKNIASVIMIASGISGMFYYNMVFFFGYMQFFEAANIVREYSLYGFIFYALVLLGSGTLSDYFKNPFLMMLISAVLMIILALPMNEFKSLPLHFINILVLGVFVGPSHAILYKLFPTEYRYRGISIAYGIGTSLIGGLTPFVCTYFSQKIPVFPAIWLMFVAVIGLGGVLIGNQVIKKGAERLL
jgi:MHS family proline/betaine transporter-like MFS transporter